MLEQRSRSRGRQAEQAAEATAETGRDPAVMIAAASVLLSWHQFFLRGNRDVGLFVGLWPPTILAFASYFKQTRMSDRLESGPGSNLIEAIDRVVGTR